MTYRTAQHNEYAQEYLAMIWGTWEAGFFTFNGRKYARFYHHGG